MTSEDYADRPVHPTGNPLTLGDGSPWPTADLHTNRALHVARRLSAYVQTLSAATWYAEDGDRYATTNVVVTEPVVTHFRAPLPGGPVEVSAVDSSSYSPTGLTVTEFRYEGTHGIHEYTAYGIVGQRLQGVKGQPQ